jgi:hypothetical protein
LRPNFESFSRAFAFVSGFIHSSFSMRAFIATRRSPTSASIFAFDSAGKFRAT